MAVAAMAVLSDDGIRGGPSNNSNSRGNGMGGSTHGGGGMEPTASMAALLTAEAVDSSDGNGVVATTVNGIN